MTLNNVFLLEMGLENCNYVMKFHLGVRMEKLSRIITIILNNCGMNLLHMCLLKRVPIVAATVTSRQLSFKNVRKRKLASF